MRSSITQKHDFGCGVACVSFATGITYEQSVEKLGRDKAATVGFLCRELVAGLDDLGLNYETQYVTPKIKQRIYNEGVIVFIKRTKHYPFGHYLIRHDGLWMDSWINLPFNKNLQQARSGFRRRLPGKPIYAILPL